MLYINGQWLQGNGAAFQSTNPATGEILWEGNAADEAQVQQAVSAAHDAFEGWADMAFDERVAILTRFHDIIAERKDELSERISQEMGKVKWDADGEVAGVIGKLKFSLKAYEERTPSKSTDLPAATAQLTHRPHGVMAVYGPYNFPAHLPNGHITPALLAGNTVAFKPSEHTPMVAEWTVKCWEEAGLPAGVLNLVQGEKETGMALSNAPIDGLLFTGSSATGLALHHQFAGRPEVMLAMELGGNNPLIVEDISNINSAVVETILSAFIAAGQRCTCARRLFLIGHETNQAYLDALVAAAGQLVVGAYNDTPAPFMGPLVSNHEASRLMDAYASMLEAGGKPLLDMTRHDANLPFLTAGIVDVTGINDLPDEEYFGPLLKIIRVPDLETAIHQANQTRYGLSSALLSDNPESFEYCLKRLRAGLLNWNQPTTGASGMAPFGGVGCSGNHHPAGYYAADYCAYPVATMRRDTLQLPQTLPDGLSL